MRDVSLPVNPFRDRQRIACERQPFDVERLGHERGPFNEQQITL